MTSNDDDTPAINRNRVAEVWSMHPELPKVGSAPKIPVADAVPLVGGTGANQRILEDILGEVQKSLVESRLIREAGQATAAHSLKMFERLPSLERRMNRVEMIAIGATIINIVMLFVVSCR